jgi:hypothetical protein
VRVLGEGVSRIISHGNLYPKTGFKWRYLPSLPEEENFWALKPTAVPLESKDIILSASVVGQIERLGPSLSDFLSSPETGKAWDLAITNHFLDSTDRNRAQAQNKRLSGILYHSQAIKYQHVRHYGAIEKASRLSSYPLKCMDSANLFIGSNISLGLVPSRAQIGDFVCQFWNSSAAALVQGTGRENIVIGRVAIVQRGESLDWDVPVDHDRFFESSNSSLTLNVDLETLTALSFDTVVMP